MSNNSTAQRSASLSSNAESRYIRGQYIRFTRLSVREQILAQRDREYAKFISWAYNACKGKLNQ